MKIKLISPRMSLRPMDSDLKRKMAPPLSLATLASMTPEVHMVYIEDENVNNLNLNDDPDLVGITVNVDTFYRAIRIAKQYRKRGIKVVFGGIHASACPDAMTPYCDAVCVGEAEGLWQQIIKDTISNTLKPIYIHSESPELSTVPIVNWNLIKNKKKYLYYNIIVTSRGCPFKCEFCYNSCEYMNRKYRNRPVNDIICEIKNISSRQIMFIDDNFIGNISWTEALLEQMKPMNLVWHAAVSTNIVNYPGLISKMAKCGCRSLFIGFESINENSIKSVNKQQNKISEYEKLIKMLHDNGIMVNASLVFGFDNDTVDTFEKTLQWLVKNRIETMTGHILTPYPGTTLYKRLKKEERIICRDLEKYNTAHVVFQPKNMTQKQLSDGYRKMYKDFYSLKNIWRRRPQNKRIAISYFLFNLGYRKFGKVTSLLGKLNGMNYIGRLARRLSYGI